MIGPWKRREPMLNREPIAESPRVFGLSVSCFMLVAVLSPLNALLNVYTYAGLQHLLQGQFFAESGFVALFLSWLVGLVWTAFVLPIRDTTDRLSACIAVTTYYISFWILANLLYYTWILIQMA
jgi:hypothetical protein